MKILVLNFRNIDSFPEVSFLNKFDLLFLPYEMLSKVHVGERKICVYKNFGDLAELLKEFSQIGVFYLSDDVKALPLPVPTVRLLPEVVMANMSRDDLITFIKRSNAIITEVELSKDLYPKRLHILCKLDSLFSVEGSDLADVLNWANKDYFPDLAFENIRIRIVTPSYNHAAYIERTIGSVLSQNYRSFSYYVMDGGSRDETKAILNNFEDLLIWRSEPDRGYADAVNKGFSDATEDYYLWVPSDDMIFDEYVLRRFVREIRETNADVVYADALYCDEHDRIVDYYPTQEFKKEVLRSNCFICQPATIFSARYFKRSAGLDIKFKSIADYDLWVKMAEMDCKFVRAGFVGAYYRLQKNSITVSQRILTYTEIFTLHLERFGKVPSEWVEGALHEMSSRRGACSEAGVVPRVNLLASRKVALVGKDMIRKLAYRSAVVQWLLLYLMKRAKL